MPSENIIQGVAFKELKTHPDDRGFFRELIRFNDPFFAANDLAMAPTLPAGNFGQSSFGQWSHSKMGKNTVKAWHFHHLQIDWWYVPMGVVQTVLYDLREESPTFKQKMEFKLGDSALDSECLSVIVRIPQGVLHGCKVLSESAHLFYITSRTYDPSDEGRYPYNSPLVPHNWGAESSIVVAPNDCRTFIPSAERIKVK